MLFRSLDIHTGGIDHIPVHHTNEIAQSEAATGQQFSKSWLHTNHVLVDGQKISKSLGNGVRLTELVEKGFEPQAFRLLVLESHYRSQSKFSLESLQAAANRLKDLKAMAVLRYQLLEKPQDDTSFSFADVADQIQTYLADDLNTPAIMAYLSDVSRQIQAVLLWHKAAPHFENMLTAIDDMLGLQLADVPDISAEQKELLRTREIARQAKDWPAADAARNKLLQQGIEVRDTPNGPIWNWD